MATRYDTSSEDGREEGITVAGRAVQRGRLVVVPTDTVYGIAADAFNADAVAALLAAKGRGRQKPPPVLVSAKTTPAALGPGVPDWARALPDLLRPRPLELVLPPQT